MFANAILFTPTSHVNGSDRKRTQRVKAASGHLACSYSAPGILLKKRVRSTAGDFVGDQYGTVSEPLDRVCVLGLPL